jgi:hypothetical protein
VRFSPYPLKFRRNLFKPLRQLLSRPQFINIALQEHSNKIRITVLMEGGAVAEDIKAVKLVVRHRVEVTRVNLIKRGRAAPKEVDQDKEITKPRNARISTWGTVSTVINAPMLMVTRNLERLRRLQEPLNHLVPKITGSPFLANLLRCQPHKLLVTLSWLLDSQ